MIVWRICKSKYVGTAFSGIGAEETGGRWNSPGRKVVYASENLSLAALKLFVHVNPRIIPTDLMVVLAQLPSRFSKTILEPSDLPPNWRNFPARAELQELVDEWLRKSLTLALIVPSAVNPIDSNVLLNPNHPQMKGVKLESPEKFDFDPRMFALGLRRIAMRF